MANGSAAISVTVDDLSSAVLRKINAGLKSVNTSTNQLAKSAKGVDGKSLTAMQKSTRALGESIADIANGSAFKGITSGFSSVASAAGKVAGAITAIAPPLLALTGAASIAGVVRMTTAWGDFASKLGNVSSKVGAPVDQLQAMENGARRAGVEAGVMTGSIESLSTKLQEMRGGRDAEGVAMFQKFGIALNNADGSARSTIDIYGDLANTMKKFNNPALASKFQGMFLGSTDASLLAYLSKGKDAMNASADASREHGVTTLTQVEAAKKLQTAYADLTQSVEGFGNAIAEKMSPALVEGFQAFSKFLDANREWVGLKMGEYATEFIAWLHDGGWQSTWENIKHIATEIKSFVDAMGGAKTIAEEFLGLWALSKVAVIVGNIGLIGAAIRGVTGLSGISALLGLGGSAAVGAATGAGGVGARVLGSIMGGLGVGGALGGALAYGVYRGATMGPEGTMAAEGSRERLHQDQRRGANLQTQDGFGPDGQPISSSSPLDARARGLLDAIAIGESGGDYTKTYGGGHLADFSNTPAPSHPILSGPNAGLTSSAHGRYQFLNSTWDEAASALGLHDKTPASQDAAAWWLAQRDYTKRTGRDLGIDLKSNDPAMRESIGRNLAGTWTSLNGGIESTVSGSRFAGRLEAAINRQERQGGIQPSGPALDMNPANRGTLAPAAQVSNGSVSINLQGNLPVGITPSVTSTGSGIILNNSLGVSPAFPFGGF